MSARMAVYVAAAIALALFPLVGGKFGVDFVTKTMVFAILALSLELLVGQVGLVGQLGGIRLQPNGKRVDVRMTGVPVKE